jgi:TRAP-type C4-dicarboxylate transport system permease small subunit|tara:strand:- start:1672 stop:2223 length:552 start_codon:yes stop_codon:yes gene_type:complete
MEPIGDREVAAAGPRFLLKLEGALVALSICCILLMCFIITTTIIGRTLFGLTIPDDVIMVRELMIGAVVLPLASVAAHRMHIMIEVFTSMLPESFQPWLNLLGSLIGSIMLLPVLYGGYLGFVSVVSEGAYFFGELDLPEWPGRLIFLLGYSVFILRLFVLSWQDLTAAAHSVSRSSSHHHQG